MYTVKEIAKSLNVNEETVRRWIRNGELKSEYSSKKDGNKISSTAFAEFLVKHPKYRTYNENIIEPVEIDEASKSIIKTFIKTLDSNIEKMQQELDVLIRIREKITEEL